MEIPKAYEPQSVEDKWYEFWQKHGCFTADPARVNEKRPAFSIVIPPPNVTGVLHMGHVLNNTIQDILARKARMDGKEVLWLPGTDHAGIATEGMVTKQIRKEEKKSKQEIGREEFIKRVWTWKEKHGGIIIEQLKKLGCSCDWTRERFTMDPDYVRNVQRVFVDLYKKGLIYRGKRMVNWCPATQTALSDEEVDMKPQKGFMYHFRVEVAEKDAAITNAAQPLSLAPSDGERVADRPGEGKTFASQIDSEGHVWLTIATTRPETIPGDTAVAVNPKDPRYAHLIGKHIIRPLPIQLPQEKKLIPIIGDEHVDFEFGTGVLKVTPAHDKADFEIGQRHKLPVVDIMNPNGTMNELAGDSLVGLDRFEARKVAVERLKELGAMLEEKPYENNVGFSQRADVPIEPRLSEQWFLKYPAVEQSKACVEQAGSADHRVGSTPAQATSRDDAPRSDKMHFHPDRWAKVYDHWLTNIQDWCISRQLWWGHRIPVWNIRFDKINFRQLHREVVMNVETICQADGKESPDGLWSGIASFSAPKGAPKTDRSIMQVVDASTGEELVYELLRFPKDSFELRALTDSRKFAQQLEKAGFTQDPDVLDTWFSSWLWPFATMGWPEKTETLKKFYPTTDLVTGPDIIFFWVARMIMAGYEYMGEMPFKNVYFTGIVRDKNGDKMSKTLGNSPDPIPLMESYGADAIRFGILRSTPLGADAVFEDREFDRYPKDKRYDFANIQWKTDRFPQLELARNLCNKLWNACRYRQLVGQASRLSPSDSHEELKNETGETPVLRTYEIQGEINPSLLTSDDKWILLKLHQAIQEITAALNDYNFSAAAQTLYRFFWSEYCDWYVEASKAVLGRGPSEASPANVQELPLSPSDGERAGVRGHLTLGGKEEARRANTLAVIDFVLSHTLRLFHPFLPFITEELWHGMGYATDMPENQGGKTIMNAPWPKPFEGEFRDAYALDDCYLEFANQKYEVVTQGRNLRRIGNIQSGKKVKFILKPSRQVLPHDAEVVKILLNAEALDLDENYAAKKGTPTAHTPMGELFLPLEGHVDPAAEIARLTKEKEKIQAEIAKVEQKLANPAFTQKVPPQVLQEHHQRLADWQAKLEHVKAALETVA